MAAAVLDRIPPDHLLPAVPYRLRPYDGPTTTADMTEESERLAEARAAIQGPYSRRPGDVRTLLWRARALDIPVGVAIDQIFINMSGRAGLSAQLTAALLRRAGITWTTVAAPHKVTHCFFERAPYRIGRGPRTGETGWRRIRRGSSSYSLDDARAAGVASSQHWKRWPQECMWARAIARGARRLFPDVTMGLAYTPEEIATGTDTPPTGSGVDPAVTDFVEQARSADATPDLIRGDIMARARKWLKKTADPAGLTLGQVLADIWQYKTEQAAAAAADAVMAAAGIHPAGQPVDEPASSFWADGPLGEGDLPCRCPATVLLTGVHDPAVHVDEEVPVALDPIHH